MPRSDITSFQTATPQRQESMTAIVRRGSCQPDMNIYTLYEAPLAVMATSHLEILGARGDVLFIRG